MQIWSLSKDKREYDNFHNLLNGKLKHTVNVEKLNKALMSNQLEWMNGQMIVSIVYDGSDIRKPESEQLEHLGWVRSLSGGWVRGYSTFNSIAIDRTQGRVRLLNSVPYSNRDPQFLSDKERKSFERGKLADSQRVQAIETFLEQELVYNQKELYFSTIRSNHASFKAQDQDIVLTHILDRGHDDEALFDLIDRELGDKFVIRLKSNRNSALGTFDAKKQKEVFIKWGIAKMAHREEKQYERLCLNNKVYAKPSAIFESDTIVLKSGTYTIVRIRFYDCQGRPIFKEPMLLITNYTLTQSTSAQFIYQLYVQRSKIEDVFKFLKDVLGWETFRVHDFESIKNIISLCFFVGAYFYDIQHELTKNESVQWICELGGSKGKVSRYFFLKGLQVMLTAQFFETFKRDNNISKEQVEEAMQFVT